MNEVNIKGLDKVELLRRLWENQSPEIFLMLIGLPSPPFNEELAKHAVVEYIDYFQGRCIKTDISGDVADTRLYDRDAGSGVFEKIVNNMR